MLTATSFLFKEGEEVSARICDYLSYKDLCLLCPICREPVILASRFSDKQTPHFRHRRLKEGDREETLVCDNRVRPLSPKEIRKLEVKARDQRISTLRKHFWMVLCTSLETLRLEHFIQDSKDLWAYVPTVEASINTWRDMNKEGGLNLLIDKLLGYMVTEDNEKVMRFLEPLNLEVHKKTILGICDFLSLKSCHPLLLKLIAYSHYEYVCYSVKDPVQFPPLETGFDPSIWIITHTIGVMCIVPWQEAMYAAQHNLPIPKGITRRPRLATALIQG